MIVTILIDFEWEPPSEAEMKILEARRERSDKISKLMGDYLLKGYKMLGSVCEMCDVGFFIKVKKLYTCTYLLTMRNSFDDQSIPYGWIAQKLFHG